MSDVESFRAETRDWLEAHCPESMRLPLESADDLEWGGSQSEGRTDDRKRWLDAMGERGWICPTWSVEYGGAGLDAEHTVEAARLERARRLAQRVRAPLLVVRARR